MPAGYPTLARSVDALHSLAQHADVLEVGLPFSDPMLDGPVIQEASATALAAGFRIKDLFTAISIVSAAASAALLVMSYWNPIARYSPDRFAAELAAAGGSGLVVPDLPVEEAQPWLRAAATHPLHTVFVVAPTTSDARLSRVCRAGSGMVYAPAAAGVTGSGKQLQPGLPRFIDRLRTLTRLPVAVGIGISTPSQAGSLAPHADCVVVGSALIQRFREASTPRQVQAVTRFAAELMHALTTDQRFRAHPSPDERGQPLIFSRDAALRAENTTATDAALAAFLRARIAEVDIHGCGAERKALAGVHAVLSEFEEKHDRVTDFPSDDYFVGQIDALRWVLQCVVAATFSGHPDAELVLPAPRQGAEAAA